MVIINAFCFGAVIASVMTVVMAELLIGRQVPDIDMKLSGILTLVHVALGVLCSLFFIYDEFGETNNGIEWWMPLIVTAIYLVCGVAFISEVLRKHVKLHVPA